VSQSLALSPNDTHATSPAESSVRQGWCYPPPVKRFATKLLDQQLWCWGRDISSPDGNLLIEQGFQRHRQPDAGAKGCTCYRLDDDARHVALWGFGIFYGERELGGLLIRRFGFTPEWLGVESLALGIHSAQALPPFSRPSGADEWRRAHRLCAHLVEWIAGYERAILDSQGPAYREACIRDWLRPFTLADRTAHAWQSLKSRRWDTDLQQWRTTADRCLLDP